MTSRDYGNCTLVRGGGLGRKYVCKGYIVDVTVARTREMCSRFIAGKKADKHTMTRYTKPTRRGVCNNYI